MPVCNVGACSPDPVGDVRSGGKTVFVLVYFESSLMDSLPRMFAHGDRINSIKGTVADSIDRYLRALKEHNGGLNA